MEQVGRILLGLLQELASLPAHSLAAWQQLFKQRLSSTLLAILAAVCPTAPFPRSRR